MGLFGGKSHKERYIERERRFNEEKQAAFLEKQEEEKEGEKPSVFKKGYRSVSSKLRKGYQPYKRAGQTVAKPAHELAEGIRSTREEGKLRGFQRKQERIEKEEDRKERLETKIFGRTLTPEEREKFEEHKKRTSASARIERFSEGFQQFESVAKSLQANDSALTATALPPIVPDYDSLLYGPAGKPKYTKPKSKGKSQARDPLFSHLDADDPLRTFWLGSGKGKKRKDPFKGLY